MTARKPHPSTCLAAVDRCKLVQDRLLFQERRSRSVLKGNSSLLATREIEYTQHTNGVSIHDVFLHTEGFSWQGYLKELSVTSLRKVS